MSDIANLPAPQGQLLINADGASRLQVRLDGNTVWFTQKLIAELYGGLVKTVSEHLVNILIEGELPKAAVIRKFRITTADGKSNDTQPYFLDAKPREATMRSKRSDEPFAEKYPRLVAECLKEGERLAIVVRDRLRGASAK